MAGSTCLRGTQSILFVCLGNICRSPMAEGIFRSMAQSKGLGELRIDSAGTGRWHEGDPPDSRSIAVAAEYGVDITGQRARTIRPGDFERFELIVAMDRSNVSNLVAAASPSSHHRIHHFMTLARNRPVDVPDPYLGGSDGFESVYRMLQEGCEALLARMR
ncbi:MAG: low molecular weight phosphotyrosine protein phosphatase [Alphaproteobacteria bacterium]|nr:low molecular weight phosphotyrosine protein phosphatase [Alphaproteobacteria bacterium]